MIDDQIQVCDRCFHTAFLKKDDRFSHPGFGAFHAGCRGIYKRSPFLFAANALYSAPIPIEPALLTYLLAPTDLEILMYVRRRGYTELAG